MLAPIVVFAYNRERHLRNTLEALERCTFCEQSNLIVFSDGPKNNSSQAGVAEVRKFLQAYSKRTRFNEIEIVEAVENKGLAKNIIEGVGSVIEKYGKVIVVEDDVTVAPYFIKYMNDALDYFENNNKIFSIGGLTVPMNLPLGYQFDVIRTQRCSSSCWATWENRWSKIDWNMPDYGTFRFAFKKRKSFNQWGTDRSAMLDDQMNHRINSWAIRFDYYMWKNNQYNIIPVRTLANHEGADGSGTHSGTQDISRNIINDVIWEECADIRMDDVPIIEEIRKEFCKSFDMKWVDLFKRYISNLTYEIRNR